MCVSVCGYVCVQVEGVIVLGCMCSGLRSVSSLEEGSLCVCVACYVNRFVSSQCQKGPTKPGGFWGSLCVCV